MSNYNELFSTCNSVNECLAIRDRLMNEGEVKEIKESLKSSSSEQKKELGQRLNVIRTEIQAVCDAKIKEIQTEKEKDNFTEFDPTFYSEKYKTKDGDLHPLSLVLQEVVEIFSRMGFDCFDGPLVLDQWTNFTSVNTPDYHPARDMQDTFFLAQKDEKGENYVMRTQATSNISQYCKLHKPPFKVIFPGLTFRNENIDATHDINFFQVDMWLVDKKASVSQLVTLLQRFFSEFFDDKDLKVRLRPSYFPFVNPGFEGDISSTIKKGEGVEKNTGWIEVVGAGPIHRDVLRMAGIDPDEWQGVAFGLGLDRLAQLKLGITQESQFYNGNLRFIRGKK